MTDREKAIVMSYTGYTMLTGDKLGIFYDYVTEKLGRTIMTHELAYDEVADEIKRSATDDFYALCMRDDTAMEAPTVNGWISVKDRMPPNADHPGAFCPKYQVMTKYGVTYGWYNPDKGCWYTLVWFYLGRKTFDDIDFERGDIPGITDKIEVTHWKEIPEPPKEEE